MTMSYGGGNDHLLEHLLRTICSYQTGTCLRVSSWFVWAVKNCRYCQTGTWWKDQCLRFLGRGHFASFLQNRTICFGGCKTSTGQDLHHSILKWYDLWFFFDWLVIKGLNSWWYDWYDQLLLYCLYYLWEYNALMCFFSENTYIRIYIYKIIYFVVLFTN